jgi:hypothetical protein
MTMSHARAEERIALLQARGQSQRLAAQLALIEARAQLRPLRGAVGALSAVARAFASGGTVGIALRVAARIAASRPQLWLPIFTIAWGLLKRRPVAVALATAAGAAAWWLLGGRREPPAHLGRQEAVIANADGAIEAPGNEHR